MKVRYRNDLYGNYMLIEIPKDQNPEQYSFRMLEKNKIPGVLPGKERMEDGKGYWYVDISKKRNLIQEYQDREIQLEDMIVIFQQMLPVFEELRNYLLNETMAVMDPEYIFRDLEDSSFHILALPWISEEKTIHKLAEFFLEKINHRDENGVNAAYLFYRQQSQSQFSIYHFLPLLEKESILKRQKIQEKTKIQSVKENREEDWKETGETDPENYFPEDLEEKGITDKDKKKRKQKFYILFIILAIVFLILGFLPMVSSALKVSFLAFSGVCLGSFFIFLIGSREVKEKAEEEKPGRNTGKKEEYRIQNVEIGSQETVFFDCEETEEYLRLQWKEKGRKKQFVLKEFPCTVGKMREEVSMIVSDLTVSRVHCRFVKRENKICIMDLNSTNGTFLNGLAVKSGEILEIEKNDEILIGKVRISVV